MAVTTDIIRTWRGPRRVMADLLAMGQREDRAVAYLMAGCILVFVAQWPRLSRIAHVQGEEFDRLVTYELFAWLVIWPLAFYLIAGLSYVVGRAFSARLTPFGARLALFWAFLAATPLGLLYGLVAGLSGPGTGANLIGLGWIVAFLTIWGLCLAEAAQGGQG